MATIRFVGLPFRHCQAEPSSFVIRFRGGQIRHSGRGLAFWFQPYTTSIAELPCDDRDESFLVHGRSSDYQEVTVQGTLTFRIVEPLKLAERIDFTVDLASGQHRSTPLEQLSELLTQLTQQIVGDYLTENTLRTLLQQGIEHSRTKLRAELAEDANLKSLGLELISIRVLDISPTAELEKALQAPQREAIQQASDEAVFQRRAMAVEKERAIAENELQNQIELAIQEKRLIEQQGENERQRQHESAEARLIETESRSNQRRLESEAKAFGIRQVEDARTNAEREQVGIYKELPTPVLYGLAAKDFANRLDRIEHLSLGDSSLTPLVGSLLRSGISQLDKSPTDKARTDKDQTGEGPSDQG